tara:strand:+ start:109 stop:585 length:477 start_codon:yes stop_codon:yes gene_type:complete
MASKKYAYYNHGNRVAIVEEESVGSGGNLAVAHCTLGGYTTKDTCEAAGGQWIPSSSSSFSGNRKYVSPTSSVSDGIEIEYTYAPIDILKDESDEIDLTSYQAKALVYYLKAKIAEDGRDLQTREFYMREFKRHLEKERSARKRGPYIAMGNANMRNY